MWALGSPAWGLCPGSPLTRRQTSRLSKHRSLLGGAEPEAGPLTRQSSVIAAACRWRCDPLVGTTKGQVGIVQQLKLDVPPNCILVPARPHVSVTWSMTWKILIDSFP